MNWIEINGKLDRLEKAMHQSQMPMHYVDHYDEYQPDYQEDQVYPPYPRQQWQNNYQNQGQGYYQANQSNQQGQGNFQRNNFGNQWDYHGQMSSQNRGYTNFNIQSPSYNSYAPHEYNSYDPQDYNGYAPQQQFNDFQQMGGNYGQSSQDDEIMNMMIQLMEGQARVQADLEKFERKIDSNHGEEQAKFEDIYSHLKTLDNQIVQVASLSQRPAGSHPEKPEPNPNENCQAIILRSETELPSGGEAEKMDESKEETEWPEGEKVSVEKEADSEVLEEEDSLQKALKVKQETSFLELKEELDVMELKEASNGKTSMEGHWSELNAPSVELIPPLPQRLRYELLSSSFTCPVIENDALSDNRVCIDYGKLTASTRKHDFPWPFTDQKLFIFSDLIENVVKVVMDDFSVYGNVFVCFLSSLCRVLGRREDTNLVPNWEKCHLMVRKGIVLEHKISEKSNEDDKEKVEVIVGLKPLIAVREFRSFLGYTNFYMRFIQDTSMVAGPFSQLVYKETMIKKELVNESIVQIADWSFPFESGGVPREPLTT